MSYRPSKQMDDFNRKWNFVGKINKKLTFIKKQLPPPKNPIHQVRLKEKNQFISLFGANQNSCFCGDLNGYSMVKASHFVEEGSYFFEVEILYSNEINSNSHVRIGIAEHKTSTNMPVGSDKFSFSYRDVKGDIFYHGLENGGKEYGEPFKTGDFIGCNIFIPPKVNETKIVQNKIEETSMGEKYLFLINKEVEEIAKNSFISFYKNGKFQGIAFKNFMRGKYYPAASLFRGAKIRFNFGPNFKYPPKNLNYKPYSVLVEESVKENKQPKINFNKQYEMINLPMNKSSMGFSKGNHISLKAEYSKSPNTPRKLTPGRKKRKRKEEKKKIKRRKIMKRVKNVKRITPKQKKKVREYRKQYPRNVGVNSPVSPGVLSRFSIGDFQLTPRTTRSKSKTSEDTDEVEMKKIMEKIQYSLETPGTPDAEQQKVPFSNEKRSGKVIPQSNKSTGVPPPLKFQFKLNRKNNWIILKEKGKENLKDEKKEKTEIIPEKVPEKIPEKIPIKLEVVEEKK